MRKHLAGTGLAYKRVLILCSGGIDSIALSSLVATLPRKAAPASIDILYLDHNFRANSQPERDAALAIADKYDLTFHEVKRENNHNQTNLSQNKQDLARTWRYETAIALAHDLNCDTVLTAHHADDQLENVLMNLLGVFDGNQAAMEIERPLAEGLTLMRPLLGVSRKDIADYVQNSGLGWGEDPSNKETDYTRNKLRNVAIPLLHEIAPAGAGKLVHASESLSQDNKVRRELAVALVTAWNAPLNKLPLDKLLALAPNTQSEVVAAWLKMNLPAPRSFAHIHVENITGLFSADNNSETKLPKATVVKTKTALILTKRNC